MLAFFEQGKLLVNTRSVSMGLCVNILPRISPGKVCYTSDEHFHFVFIISVLLFGRTLKNEALENLIAVECRVDSRLSLRWMFMLEILSR